MVKYIDVVFGEDFELVWNCLGSDAGRDVAFAGLDDNASLIKSFGGWVIYDNGVTARSDEASKGKNGFRVTNIFRIIDRAHFRSAAEAALEDRSPACARPRIIIDQ